MRTRLVFSTLTLVLAGGFLSSARAQATAEDYRVQIGVDFWKPSPDLVIGTDGNPEVDLTSTFDIEDKWFTGINITGKPGRKHKIRFSWIKMEYDNDATIQQTIVFGGQTFNVNVAASAEIEWQVTQFLYEYDFVSNNYVVAGVVGGLKYNQVKAAITATGAGVNVEASTDVDAPIPAIGGAVKGFVVPGLVAVGVEITGFKLPEDEDSEGTYLDYDIFGQASLGRNLAIQGGYRSIDVEYLIDGDSGRPNMKGPYISAAVKF